MAGSVIKDTFFSVVDMLCNIGGKIFFIYEAENVRSLPGITLDQIFMKI